MAVKPDTQLDAWDQIQHNIPARRLSVLALIKSHSDGLPLFRIADILNWQINCVSGRVTELKNMGLIVKSGKTVNPDTKKAAIVWKYKDPVVFFEPNGQGNFIDGNDDAVV